MTRRLLVVGGLPAGTFARLSKDYPILYDHRQRIKHFALSVKFSHRPAHLLMTLCEMRSSNWFGDEPSSEVKEYHPCPECLSLAWRLAYPDVEIEEDV